MFLDINPSKHCFQFNHRLCPLVEVPNYMFASYSAVSIAPAPSRHGCLLLAPAVCWLSAPPKREVDDMMHPSIRLSMTIP